MARIILTFLVITMFAASGFTQNDMYTSISDVKKAGKEAIGKKALLSVKVISFGTRYITVVDDKGNYFKIHFDEETRKKVRSLKKRRFYKMIIKIRYVSDSGEITFDM